MEWLDEIKTDPYKLETWKRRLATVFLIGLIPFFFGLVGLELLGGKNVSDPMLQGWINGLVVICAVIMVAGILICCIVGVLWILLWRSESYW